jgi:hypothetical protein
MGRRKDGNHSLQKNNNSIQDSVQNEGNVYPFLDPNKAMINVIKKPSDVHKNTVKEEILEEI